MKLCSLPRLELLEGRWLPSTVVDLGTLGGTDSYAYAVNDLGQVAGASGTADGNVHAFIHDGATGWVKALRAGRWE